ncbi:MAG: Holliday junction resolvase RuvX [Firmicutes bacterium]|nr:Holliday junction resolvase RuvX [Alicyclobacillaceae bacterium]MCL6496632.1 Holliday junction resolvase RuvX [Bacillota bacterium]
MALDVGDKWIGVAVSDETRLVSQPDAPIVNRGEDTVREILSRAEAWQAEQIVVGLPVSLNHTIGPQAIKVLRMVDALRERFWGSVVTWDERLTSRMAERLLIEQAVRRKRRKALVDGLAAALLLQSYLDFLRRQDSDHPNDPKAR